MSIELFGWYPVPVSVPVKHSGHSPCSLAAARCGFTSTGGAAGAGGAGGTNCPLNTARTSIRPPEAFKVHGFPDPEPAAPSHGSNLWPGVVLSVGAISRLRSSGRMHAIGQSIRYGVLLT